MATNRSPFKSVRGMRAILPAETAKWQALEQRCQALLQQYGYEEIRLPIVEQAALFHRSVGESSDIVGKEMYQFNDRNGDLLALRPEGTAGCARAVIEHHLLYQGPKRLWYSGPMFRHERPQKGRYRQFMQLGVEAYGFAGSAIEAELIALSWRLWQVLGISHKLTLQINTLGVASSRQRYRQALVDYFTPLQAQLDDDSRKRLTTNPLRILDSKNPDVQALIARAPTLDGFLTAEEKAHWQALRDHLDALGIPYVVNPRLVRGLDYYMHTVFEWCSKEEGGAQNTVCAGGRYDDLLVELGGKPSSAVGFALGVERLLALCDEIHYDSDGYAYFMVSDNEAARSQALCWVEQLRAALPSWTIWLDLQGGSFKSQFKRAHKAKAQIALVLGEEELASQQVTLNYLQQNQPSERLDQASLIKQLKATKPKGA